MCTLVILRRPGHEWPLLVAANRDERADRAWRGPGRHWPDRPKVVATQDCQAAGSWLGINDDGVVAALTNRAGSLGAAPGKRSRGELVLEALDHTAARSAVEALTDLDPRAYRPFNLVVADIRSAYWLRNRGPRGPGYVEIFSIRPGLSMMTAGDINDPASPRVRVHLPRFRIAPAPRPAAGDWSSWEHLLASRLYDAAQGPTAAMAFDTEGGFGTLCSALVALPAGAHGARRPLLRFAAGPPGRTPFEAVSVEAPRRRSETW